MRLFGREIASRQRRCANCGRKIHGGELVFTTARYRYTNNYCIICIGEVTQNYLKEMQNILKSITIKKGGKNGRTDVVGVSPQSG
jgi:hypothetical protein